MEGRGVKWSREILSDLGWVLEELSKLRDRGVVPSELLAIYKVVERVYGNIESPYVTYEELKELFIDSDNLEEEDDKEEYPWYLGEDL